MNISRQQIDKLIVGTNDVSYVDSDTSPTGSAILNGPVLIGDPTAAPGYEAVLNVSSNSATQSPLDTQPSCEANLAIKADGNVKIDGDGKTADALVVTGDQTINSGNLHTSNLLACSGQACAWSGSSINVQGWKGFDISHPSKKGYRLRHVCLEGPEGGVYIRGKVKNDKVILLPDYWKDLVDINSITVQLQPIGAHQDIIVKRWDAEKVELQSKPGIPIHCFYHIFAERIDGEQLVVEYKGETPDEYPGDNTQYSIAGYHYDTRN